MAYEKQAFVNRIADENGAVVQEGTKLKAEHLNHMEDGIKSAHDNIKTLSDKVDELSNSSEEENNPTPEEPYTGLTKEEADELYQHKGNYLTEHQKIKTINGQSLVGEGNIEIKPENKRSISILFVGNSLTQDGIAYLPYMLKTYYPEIDFKIYMWYIGGYTLEQHYSTFTNGGKANSFSVAENSATWTNHSKDTTMAQVLSTYTFDVVCMQEYFNYKTEYTDATDWNNCRDYIVSNYKGGNALEFVSLFHAPLRSNADAVFDMTKNGNALILQETISQDMIPNGIAVYRALSTDLDTLGDQQHLSPDGTHTQEGLPCLLQTYVTLCWLFDRLSINKSVYGSPMRMTTAIYNTLSVPGANLGNGVVTGTDAQNLLAQEVAIKAYKEGKQFTMFNLGPFEVASKPMEYTLTIETNVSGATIKLNGVVQSSIVVIEGTTVNWEVSKDEYHTQAGSVVVNRNETITVELLPTIEIESINAEFTQGARTIFSDQEFNGLRHMLTVTVTYEDGTIKETDDYTLSGSLTNGTDTITATFGGKSATFDVNTTAFALPEGYTRYGYIQRKASTKGSTYAQENFIWLPALENINTLSLEATLGQKPSTTNATMGIFGARPESGLGYCVYQNGTADDPFYTYLRGAQLTIPAAQNLEKINLVIDNPEASPYTVYINGTSYTKAWSADKDVAITTRMSLFNNIPAGNTSAMYINHTARIGDMLFRNYSGECVAYFTPCLSADGKIGMYDQITETFYTASKAAAVTQSNSGVLYALGNW